jgi:hypothetical protein
MIPLHRLALRALGAGFLALAFAFYGAARQMMALASSGEVCGALRHCAACPATAVAALLGIAALVLSAYPSVELARVRK